MAESEREERRCNDAGRVVEVGDILFGEKRSQGLEYTNQVENAPGVDRTKTLDVWVLYVITSGKAASRVLPSRPYLSSSSNVPSELSEGAPDDPPSPSEVCFNEIKLALSVRQSCDIDSLSIRAVRSGLKVWLLTCLGHSFKLEQSRSEMNQSNVEGEAGKVDREKSIRWNKK